MKKSFPNFFCSDEFKNRNFSKNIIIGKKDFNEKKIKNFWSINEYENKSDESSEKNDNSTKKYIQKRKIKSSLSLRKFKRLKEKDNHVKMLNKIFQNSIN